MDIKEKLDMVCGKRGDLEDITYALNFILNFDSIKENNANWSYVNSSFNRHFTISRINRLKDLLIKVENTKAQSIEKLINSTRIYLLNLFTNLRGVDLFNIADTHARLLWERGIWL